MAVLVAMTGNIALLMVVVVCSFFVIAHRRGQLPLRQGFGVRTLATTTDDQTWFAAHEAAAPALVRTAQVAALSMIPSVVIGMILGRFFPLAAESAALALVFIAYGVTGWFLVKAVRVADAAAHALLYPGGSDAEEAPSTPSGLESGVRAAAREPGVVPAGDVRDSDTAPAVPSHASAS